MYVLFEIKDLTLETSSFLHKSFKALRAADRSVVSLQRVQLHLKTFTAFQLSK